MMIIKLEISPKLLILSLNGITRTIISKTLFTRVIEMDRKNKKLIFIIIIIIIIILIINN